MKFRGCGTRSVAWGIISGHSGLSAGTLQFRRVILVLPVWRNGLDVNVQGPAADEETVYEIDSDLSELPM